MIHLRRTYRMPNLLCPHCRMLMTDIMIRVVPFTCPACGYLLLTTEEDYQNRLHLARTVQELDFVAGDPDEPETLVWDK